MQKIYLKSIAKYQVLCELTVGRRLYPTFQSEQPLNSKGENNANSVLKKQSATKITSTYHSIEVVLLEVNLTPEN